MTEWARIFDTQQLMDDLQHPSKLLAFAAIDVLEVQHEHVDRVPHGRDRGAERSRMRLV